MERDRRGRFIDLGNPQRFWKAIRVTERGCWEWQGYVYPNGYGRVYVPGKGAIYTHRYAYELAHGYISNELYVCHTCDNRRCINPAHLWLGTATDNNRDREHKGRGGGKRLASHWRGKPPQERMRNKPLPDELIREIRKAYKAGGVTHKQLAKQYNQLSSVIRRIISRESYWWVAEE